MPRLNPTDQGPPLSPKRVAGALAFYLLLAAAFTYPLLLRLGTAIPSDPGDPALNASIVNWNAWNVPFTSGWWNAPQYFPTEGITAFTENLVGFSPISTPLVWLTKNVLVAYNTVMLLTYALSAWTMCLLVLQMTRRMDAALLAGLAFGFTPYRAVETSHIQMLVTWWMPLILLCMHAYLEDGRARWLWMLGISWILNSLSNGHFMLFGAVLFALWLAYFGSTPRTARRALIVLGVWMLASLPLAPIMWQYQTIHTAIGLARTDPEILAYAAQPSSWAHVHPDAWLWSHALPDAKDNLFPGIAALTLMLAGVVAAWRRGVPSSRPRVVAGAAIVLLLALAITLVTLVRGPWEWLSGDVTIFKVTELSRAFTVIALSAATIVYLTPALRQALGRRSPLVFYAAMIVVSVVLCCGPMLRVGEYVLFRPLPYRWLMLLPGFHELRVPPRFWMIGVMCLSAAAGLAFAQFKRPGGAAATALFAVGAVGILADGWMPGMRLADPPEIWAAAEPPEAKEPLLELPIGPEWDFAATYRAGVHQRRVVNGVSGYNPPYYLGLVAGLQARDPATLSAVAAYGPIDVLVNRPSDPDGAVLTFVSTFPGAAPIADDGRRAVYRIPRGAPEPPAGRPLAIRNVIAARNNDSAATMHDGRLESGWDDYPQKPDAFVLVDLGSVQDVGGVTMAIGDHFLDYPRRLVIEVSVDGSEWSRGWDAPTTGPLFLAYVRAPRVGDMRFTFSARPARYVRLRETEAAPASWRISELTIHGPADPVAH
jgi:hypothetical protein